ncbi:hypothetical protein F4808DRAFT_466642 [Astrocystis sublimbata]|nr:hypothetical protein F4808DRAFT_466642 [Astrocystis sublimbata]
MASEALDDVSRIQKQALQEQYAGKMSNQFVDELKGSTLFQFSWGELLSAAPTALSLMGACWLAAASPAAEKISMSEVVPIVNGRQGFVYLTNVKNPTLRGCLVDVCDNGGREAFTIAGRNMDALQITSQRITAEKIDLVFKRLGPCTQNSDALEDFQDALQDFSTDAKTCAKLASEIREAFSKWGKMVGELHMCTENQKGATAIKTDAISIDKAMANIEQRFATDAAKDAKEGVKRAEKSLAKAEQRLDSAIEKVPGPWATVIQGAVTGFTQALPGIVAGVLPAVLAASNPLSAIGQLAGGVAGNAAKQGALNGTGLVPPTPASDSAPSNGTTAPKSLPAVEDPSYAAAAAIRDLINHFYQFLGGEAGEIDWSKFKEPIEDSETGATDTNPQGLSFFLGNLKGQQAKLDVTNTEPNKKLIGVFTSLIKVANDMQSHLGKQANYNSIKLEPNVAAEWKKAVKQAQVDVLALTSASSAMGSSSVPNPFGNVKIDIGKPDFSAQTAQVNSAMQGVTIAQGAVDGAQANFDAAVAKQAKTAAAMAEIEAKLKRLQATGETLEEIKSVLNDCISVLVDLAIQIGKLEQFFTMLSTVIDHIVIPRAETFVREMGKAGRRALANGAIKVDDIAKQTIYTSTLQLKGYFSLLKDISSMYSMVHRDYIAHGVNLCTKLSKGAASNDPMYALQDELSTYTADSAKAVAKLVDDKQKEILKGLRERARLAVANTQLIENTVAKRGVVVDKADKDAVLEGAKQQQADAAALLQNDVGATASENTDASDF